MGLSPTDLAQMTDEEIRRLVHELQVHQIELAMQNEHLLQAQRELAESRDRARDLYDFAPVGYLTLAADTTIREANLMAASLLGRERAYLRGKRFSDLIAPECQDRFYLHRREVRGCDERQACELRLKRPEGQSIWVQVEINRGDPIGAEGPEYRCVVTDITARKQAEEALERQLRLTEAITLCAAEAIFVTDRAGRITQSNAEGERIFGYAGDELSGEDLHALLHHHHSDGRPYPHEECPLCSLYSHGESIRDYETQFFRKDGTPVQVSCSNAILKVDGESYGGVLLVHDITSRKRAEEALREAARRKDEFLATLAHELRNPLAPIANAIGILRLQGTTNPKALAAEAIIERQLKNLVRLIDDLLDVSRITRGRLELRRERVTLTSVVEAAVEGARPHIEGAGHRLTVALPDEAIPLDADPVRLAQVFLNLLNNASKYTAAGGQIHLSAGRDGAEILVRVRDTGRGIAAEDLPRLFEIFTQIGAANGAGHGGLGIGLSLAQGLVRMHGGELEACSAGLGRGSEFLVRLPVAEARPLPPVEGDQAPPAPAGPLRILVADDNPDIVDSLVMLLEAAGQQVVTARDGEEALAAADRHRPQIAILDIGMPKLDGYEVCRRLRREPWGRAMRLIALTGWGQQSDRRNAEAAGFDDHLVKPVTLSTLLQRLAIPSQS